MAGVCHRVCACECSGWSRGQKLLPSSDGGDEGDKEKFTRICGELVAHAGGAISIDVEQVWSWAQRDVERQLDEYPELMAEIQKCAAELRAILGY